MDEEEVKLPFVPSFNTEYGDNYKWNTRRTDASTMNMAATGMFDPSFDKDAAMHSAEDIPPPMLTAINNADFPSSQYPSVYRETVIHKDDRGSYIDPFVGYASKPCGRRMIYDKTHPLKMYASQYSSELADAPNIYSFPTTTGLAPTQPWKSDMGWQMEGCEAHWPTQAWKDWTKIAECPPYDGHSDQPEYSQYKVQVP